MVPWQGQRAKVQLRLANQRLRLLQEKKLAIAKQTRRDIADLLVKGRIETARLRVETLISEDIQVELLELVELYSETLLARFAVLEASSLEPDPSISDAVCALVYAAPHVELRELQLLREMLMSKFGRPFAIATMANDPPCVPQRILSKLAVYIPPIELVDAYLEEIARGYNVDWRAPDRGKKDDEDEGGDEGGLKDTITPMPTAKLPETPLPVEASTSAAVPPSSSPTISNALPPGDEEISTTTPAVPQLPPPPATSAPEKPVDEVEALLARFNALKKH